MCVTMMICAYDQARQWLVEGVQEADEDKLQWALKRSAELKLTNAGAQIDAAKAMVARIAEEKQLIASVESSIDRGGYLNEGDRIDAEELRGLVSRTQQFGMKTKAGIRAAEQASLFMQLRDTLKLAVGTKDKGLWKAVESVLIHAGEHYSSHPEVAFAREQVAHQAAVDEVCEKIQQAVNVLDQDQLAYGLQQAASLKVDHGKYPVVPIAQQYLDRIVESRRLIAAAMMEVEQSALEYAVRYAESFRPPHLENDEVKNARILRDKVIQLNTEASHANTVLEDEPMKDIVKRADDIKLTTPDIERLRTLLYSTPDEKLKQLQLKAAIALNDAPRRIRVMIQLKDMVFKNNMAMFDWNNYPNLRSKDGWADLKLISFSRDELAAGMRKHTKEPIHDPLTEINDPKQAKACKNMFKNILG